MPSNQEQLLNTLKERFLTNMHRHPHIDWNHVEEKLSNNLKISTALLKMEESGGEPDVVELHSPSNGYTFIDCAKESPVGRRSVCYDEEALQSRKANKPTNSACTFAKQMGATLLNEEEYRYLQSIEAFDVKTSSWIETPKEVRTLKGALFCDYRYHQVFTYHNGADSYYSSRGFRTKVIL